MYYLTHTLGSELKYGFNIYRLAVSVLPSLSTSISHGLNRTCMLERI